MILMNAIHLEKIANHAQATYPQECCGLLLGTFNLKRKIVIEVQETENSWESCDDLLKLDNDHSKKLSKNNRFSIAPKTLLQVQKEARDRHIDIIGIYHSHPDYPATPSAFDREIAWSHYSYIIASVEQGNVTDIKSWQLQEDRQFQVEVITINC